MAAAADLPSTPPLSSLRCSPGNSSARDAVFAHLARLHRRPCDRDTPVVVHTFTHAGLGNALGQLARKPSQALCEPEESPYSLSRVEPYPDSCVS